MCGPKFVPKDHAATKSHSSSLSAGKRKMRKLADEDTEDWEAAFRDFKDDDDDDIEPFLTGAITESFKSDSSSDAAARPKQRRRVSPTHPYHGIRQRAWGRWSAEIRDPIKGARVWIGTFDNAEYAAHAYDAEARRIHGTKARTNFPALTPPCSRLPEARRIHGTKARTNIPALPPPCGRCLPSAQCSLSSVDGKDRATESASPSNGRIQLELECCSDDVMESLLALSGLLPRSLEQTKNGSCRMNSIA